MNGRKSIVFAATTTTAMLVGAMIITASISFAQQQGPIGSSTAKQDRNQTRLIDPTTHPNATSSGSQQSIMSAPLNQSTSLLSTNATLYTKINEQFYITLDSNPTTGYEWQVASVSNPNVVEFVSSEYIPPKFELMGAGGKHVLTFNTLQEGNASLMLQYVRPWETGVPPVSIYAAEVIVENGIQQ